MLPSSNVHLDVLSNRDETVDFDDYLNGEPSLFVFPTSDQSLQSLFFAFFFFELKKPPDPEMSEVHMNVHGAMEHKLGMKYV